MSRGAFLREGAWRIARATMRILSLLWVGLMLGTIATTSNAADAESAPTPPRIRLAVMGDSNSHSYQDRHSFPLGTMWRGGPRWQPSTLQWTEVLARLRGDRFDLGPWGVWGQRGRIAQLREWVGLPARAPKKEDYLYNFAASGAGCDDLMVGRFRQAPRLAALIEEQRDAWRDAIVVVRIGIVDIGSVDSLHAMSVDPAAPDLRRRAAGCLVRIRAAIALLRSAQPTLRFVIVSVFNDANDPIYNDRWQSPTALANIDTGLALLNEPLRALAQSDRAMFYFDDNEWFARLWGTRDSRGRPAYKVVPIGAHLNVANAIGDAPHNSVLVDDHAGLVWNAWWARSLIDRLNTAWKTGIPAVTDAELAAFIERQLALAR